MFKLFDFSHWHGSMDEGSNYLLCRLLSDNIFLLGRKHVDGRVVKGAWGWEQFFSENLFSKNFSIVGLK